jgi:hypothetical protein
MQKVGGTFVVRGGTFLSRSEATPPKNRATTHPATAYSQPCIRPLRSLR